ncbi:MAG: MFS transporter [Desulfovibrionaceae bacterium CG1_02_65_16]|nr:MAG: MFS transporter [Desulfovibrionaceae bacterium CG1_02_65_16]
MTRPKNLLNFDFVAICLLIFLTYCNITVFYNLYQFLQQIGIAQQWRGFLIGCSSLATIAFFLLASPYLTPGNAPKWALVGAVLLLVCGPAYFFATSAVAILAVRLANGTAVYLLSAACMTMMVSHIPPERSGQAFSLYSVALLLPYSIVPAACGLAAPLLPSAAYEYEAASLLLVPGLALVLLIARRQRKEGRADKPQARVSLADMYRNAAAPPIAMVLLLNTLYIIAFSSLFFMAKGLFLSRGFQDVGYYFTIQMCCMIFIRAFGKHLFDRVSKVGLIRLTFVLSALSFLLAEHSTELWQLYASSLAMGIGMGFGSPALYGYMFTISPPRFKTINSNLMMLSLQVGNFAGPVFGAWAMHYAGYNGLLLADAGVCAVGIGCTYVLRHLRAEVEAEEFAQAR